MVGGPERIVRTDCVPHSNRLEDRIRNLSEKLVEAKGEEFHRLSVELRSAITDTSNASEPDSSSIPTLRTDATRTKRLTSKVTPLQWLSFLIIHFAPGMS